MIGVTLFLSACDLPRDTEGTSSRVISTPDRQGMVRIGVVEGDLAGPEAFVARLMKATRPRAHVETGATEPLLTRLEVGDLDVVVGAFDAKSPWEKRVTFSKPIERAGAIETKAATRNGEHRWAMYVDRVVSAPPVVNSGKPHPGFIDPEPFR